MAVAVAEARALQEPTSRWRRRLSVLSAMAVLTVLMVAGPLAPASSAAPPDIPMPVPAHGVHVWATQWMSDRTLRVHVESSNVHSTAVHGSHYVFITFPVDYAQRPEVNFPVLYLLHGGGGGKSSDWTTAGDVENITAGHDVITVMPDGGRVGWYTNWLNQNPPQRWADYHLNQLIPWVDANFRTNPTKQGRAIAGLSMGGYGAIRYAQDRPDLFNFAASFSGAVDLGVTETRLVIWQQSLDNGFDGNGAFGGVFFGGVWDQVDPMKRAARLQGVTVRLYAGSGTDDLDIIERTMGASTDRFHHALNAAGVPHFYWMYGRPGSSVPYGCNGGHNYGCWNFALLDSMPQMMSVLESTLDQGVIAGQVTTEDGTPVGGVTVGAFTDEDGMSPTATTTTGPDGRYSMGDLPTGSYRLVGVPPAGVGLAMTWEGSPTNGRWDATAVALDPSGPGRTQDITLVAGGSLSGTATYVDGSPVVGAIVGAYGINDTWVPSAWTTTGPDGTYEFSTLPAGGHRVVVVPPASAHSNPVWVGAEGGGPAPVHQVVGGGSLTGMDVTLPLRASLSGTVHYEGGVPAAGATVSAYAPGDVWLPRATATVAADGSFAFEDIEPDTYRLLVRAPGASEGSTLDSYWHAEPGTTDRRRAAAATIEVAPNEQVGGVAVVYPSA